jgi:predicted outer membrane repeat protein
MFVRRLLLVALLVPSLALSAAQTRAAGTNRFVVSTADGPVVQPGCTSILNFCSLREALAAAADGDTIQFDLQATGTIVLTQGSLPISHAVTIQGPGAAALAVDGGATFTVFTVNSGVTATISGITVQRGIGAMGGGINNAGTLTVMGSVVANNFATDGGGIYNTGTLTAVGSTLSDNVASGNGGGINNQGTTTVRNSTLARNRANGNGGGGIYTGNYTTLDTGMLTVTSSTFVDNGAFGNGGGINSIGFASLSVTESSFSGNSARSGGGIMAQTMTLTNSTVVGNSATSAGGGIWGILGGGTTVGGTLLANRTGGNCIGSLVSQDYNLTSDTSCMGLTAAHDLIGIDPSIDPAGLQPNGSSGTQTVALRPNSPAIDAGGSGCLLTDQRGQARVGTCDIGAYEYQPVTPTIHDAIAPASGGGVTFTGTGFQTGSQLTIGGIIMLPAPAAAVSSDGTRLTLTVPGHAVGAVGIAVTNPGTGHIASAVLTYAPVVTSVSPASGATAGGVVTITGAGFGTTGAQVSVTFGVAPAPVRSVMDSQLVVTAPAHIAGIVDVTVMVNGLSVTKTGAYTYGPVGTVPAPRPSSGVGGSSNPLPGPRPTGSSPAAGSPNPLPTGR